MKVLTFLLALNLLSAGVGGQDAADADGRIVFRPPLGSVHPPVLMCRAEVAHGFPAVVDLPLAASTDHAIEVSNLVKADVQFALHYFENPAFSGSFGRRLSLRENESIPNDPRAPNLRVEVYRVAGSQRERVDARWADSGRGLQKVDLSRDPLGQLPSVKYTEELNLSLWIPEEESARIKKLQEFFVQIERDPGPEIPQESREWLGKTLQMFRSTLQNGPAEERRKILDYWDQSSAPGEYEVVCKYRPRRSDPWQQELTAPPLRLRILYEMSPFQAILKKLAAPGNAR